MPEGRKLDPYKRPYRYYVYDKLHRWTINGLIGSVVVLFSMTFVESFQRRVAKVYQQKPENTEEQPQQSPQ